MKKLVGVLAVVTAIFAGATLHLVYELRAEQRRAREVSLAQERRPPPAAQEVAAESQEVAAESQEVATESVGSPRAPEGNARPRLAVEPVANTETTAAGEPPSASERRARAQARLKARRQQAYSNVLKQYEDPAGRGQMLANAQNASRKSLDRFPQLAGLTKAETNELVDLLAQQQVEDSVKTARCFLDTACATPERALALLDKNAKSRQVADLLGPEKAERYELFQSSREERSGVTSLRARLPDDHLLADADAERLIEALARERHKYVSEVEQAGLRAVRLATRDGSVFYRQDPADRGETRRRLSPDIGSAVDFSERMKKTASQILTTEQMRVFNEMQDDVLGVLRQRYRAGQMRLSSDDIP